MALLGLNRQQSSVISVSQGGLWGFLGGGGSLTLSTHYSKSDMSIVGVFTIHVMVQTYDILIIVYEQ